MEEGLERPQTIRTQSTRVKEVEEDSSSTVGLISPVSISASADVAQPEILNGRMAKVMGYLMGWGIETHGIAPIPIDARTQSNLLSLAWVWFSVNMGILGFSIGTAGPIAFGLGLRDSLLVLLVSNAFTCTIPAYFAVFGPKLGMRAMVQSRYSFGLYGAILPALLNVFTLQGWLIVSSIIGGQALASTLEQLDDALGVVIISALAFGVAFCGYKALHLYASLTWVPSAFLYVVMLVVGGKHLTMDSDNSDAPPPSVASIISFGTMVASANVSWTTVTADYGVYYDSKIPSVKIFGYSYLGFLSSTLIVNMLGAAFAASASSVPSWQAGLGNGNDLGGLVSAILAPTGALGKFLMVLVAMSALSSCALTMYSFGTSFMSIAPAFVKVPRFVFLLLSEAILLPVAIIGAEGFYSAFVDILSMIGYWSSAFAAIVLVEHIVFRRNQFSLYSAADWNQPTRLPFGGAGIAALLAAFGLIVLGMAQKWYTGPIARAGTGDIGVALGFFGGGILYAAFRSLERGIPIVVKGR